jgi:hypothetical protein
MFSGILIDIDAPRSLYPEETLCPGPIFSLQ